MKLINKPLTEMQKKFCSSVRRELLWQFHFNKHGGSNTIGIFS